MTETRIERAAPKAITLQHVVDLTSYSLPEIALVARTVAVGAPLEELAVFLHACRQLHLDPLLRQAYWIRRKGKGTLQVGIDGFRAIAEATGAYAGSEPPQFSGTKEWTFKRRLVVVPERARVVVWKIVQGHKAAFTGEAFWDEFVPSEDEAFMYAKMPRHMLAKDAEAQALRKAFPALLGGLNMADLGDISASGELPVVNEVQSLAPERPAITAEDYDRIFGNEPEEPPAAPEQETPPEPEE